MNHVNTKINLADGINLMTGSSDNGKSAILRALYSIFLDKHDSTWIRHGEKEYTIRITFFNGDIFEKTKGKTNALSMIPANGEARSISSYGKDMPIEFKNFLGIMPETSDGPLPFSMQKRDVFLIDKKEVALGQELSVLLQVDDLEKGAANLKKEMTKHNTQIKDHEETKKTLLDELEKYSDVDEKTLIAEKLETILEDHKLTSELLDSKRRTINFLNEILDEANVVKKDHKKTKKIFNLLSSELVEIDNFQSIVNEKNDLLDSAISIIDSIEQLKKDKKISQEFISGSIGIVVNDITTLNSSIVDKKSIIDDAEETQDEISSTNQSISNIQKKIDEYEIQIEKLLETQRISKVICSSCDGEGYITVIKEEINAK